MKLRIEKLQLAPDLLTVLGMNFDSKYLHIPPNRFAAWHNMPVRTPRQAKSFVASAAYFRTFCPSFSALALPLIKFTKQTQYSEEIESAKQNLLKVMEENCKVRLLTNEDHLILSTDASKYCAAATLEVIVGNGTELIASFSKLFTQSEVNHDIFAKEAATVIYALESFSYYLNGCRSFTLRTDVRGIIYIRFPQMKNQTSYRLAAELSRHNPTIVHIPTHAHLVTDALSRRSTDEDECQQIPAGGLTPKEAEALLKNLYIGHGRIFTMQEAANLISASATKSLVKPPQKNAKVQPPAFKPPTAIRHTIVRPNFLKQTASNNAGDWRCHRRKAKLSVNFASIVESLDLATSEPENLTQSSISLPFLKIAANMIPSGRMTVEDFVALQEQDEEIQHYLHVGASSLKKREDGIVLKNGRFYLPKVLLRSAVEAIHRPTPDFHLPKALAKRHLAQKFFRKHLMREINALYQECLICSIGLHKKLRKPHLESHFEAKEPRDAWYMDLMDLTKTIASATDVEQYAIVAIDAFSNYIVVTPIADKTKEVVLNGLMLTLAPFGKPKLIISDNESAIASDTVQNVLEANNIACHLISPHAPWGNKAEKAIGMVKQAISSINVQQQNYKLLLPTVMQALNSTPNSQFPNVTPELMFFSKEIDLQESFLATIPELSSDANALARIRKAAESMHRLRERKRAHLNRARKERVFLPGEIVFLREPTANKGKRLLSPAGSLFVIREKAGPAAYWLDNIATKATVKRHKQFIFPAEISERAQLLSPTWDQGLQLD